MELKQAFFILEHGSSEGEGKYLEAVKTIKEKCLPVVRCKDCKHLWRDLAGPFCGCGRGLREIYNDTFCSYGEKRGD